MMRRRKNGNAGTSVLAPGQDEDDEEPEIPRRVSFTRRRTESDKFVIYVARTFSRSNTATMRPVLPWIAIRLSSPEYDVGARVEDAAKWVAPITSVPPAMDLLLPGGRACRTLRLVTFRDRAWVWSKVASVAEQLQSLGMRAPDAARASSDEVTAEWRSRYGDQVPVVSRLATGALSYDSLNAVVPTPLGEVYVHRERFHAHASNTLMWGLYKDDAPHMTLVSMCKSNTVEAARAVSYKTETQAFELMLTYSPDTDMERRLPTTATTTTSGTRHQQGYAPSVHPFSFMTHSASVWGVSLVAKFREAFVDLLRSEPRMKLPVGAMTRHLPCHPVVMCDPDERWLARNSLERKPATLYGTCRHVEFTGDTTNTRPLGVWDGASAHRLEADLT
jgi:hypothetical protein